MMTSIKSLGLNGIDGFMVDVEVDVAQGLPSFDIVGLPDISVKESRERVRSAIKNCGYEYPLRKITVNLAPGNVKKEGPIYDLPIIIALLCASGIIDPSHLNGFAFAGEVSLDGQLRFINGALPLTVTAMQNGIKAIFLPLENSNEASVINGICVYGAPNIQSIIDHFSGKSSITPREYIPINSSVSQGLLDYADVKGQQSVKRALEVAAAGFHNTLLIGSPGAGKSMIAKRLPSILPPLRFDEMIESTKIHSVAGLLSEETPILVTRPFRAPHHTVSAAGLAGGGRIPKPGEISLAHNGVLFLDELPEFSKDALEVLRQPLEDNTVTISRASGTLSYPSRFMLVCAMNPCKCGYFGHPKRSCTCAPAAISSYLYKISGPLLDRIDIHIEVPPVPFDDLSSKEKSEPSADILKRVVKARQIQEERYADEPFFFNSRLSSSAINKYCRLGQEEKAVLRSAFDRLNLSARAYDRIVKVARTIADLDGSDEIKKPHVLEAIMYRSLDRKYWQR